MIRMHLFLPPKPLNFNGISKYTGEIAGMPSRRSIFKIPNKRFFTHRASISLGKDSFQPVMPAALSKG